MAELTTLDKAAIKRFAIPPRFHGARFDNFTGKANDIPESCYLHGPPGRGKTHLAVAKIKKLLEENPTLQGDERPGSEMDKETGVFKPLKNLLFWSVPALLARIRATYDNSGETEKQVMGIFMGCSYLVLDDLGAEKTTDFVRTTFYQIIDYRYNWLKPTIITSNLSLDDLATRFDDRLSSRIAGMCKVMKVDGRDHRLEGK